METTLYQIFARKCAHERHKPRFVPFSARGNRPVIIQKLLQRIDRYYWESKKYLADLRNNNSWSVNTRSARQTRSQAREAIKLVCQVLVYNLELATMTISRHDGSLSPLSLRKIAALAGVTVSRASEALSRLMRAGYLEMTRRFACGNEAFVGLPAIRKITPKFFEALGLGHEYAEQQERKMSMLRRRLDETERAATVQIPKASSCKIEEPEQKPAPVKEPTYQTDRAVYSDLMSQVKATKPPEDRQVKEAHLRKVIESWRSQTVRQDAEFICSLVLNQIDKMPRPVLDNAIIIWEARLAESQAPPS